MIKLHHYIILSLHPARRTTSQRRMQYVILEVQNQSFLIDGAEVNAVESCGSDGISDGPRLDELSTPLVVCYGAYIPQQNVSYEKALIDLLGAGGSWLGHIAGPFCELIAVRDIRSYGMQKVGRMIYLPFAALLQAHAPVISKIKGDGDSPAVTGFVRYSNMSPADNLLNRKGLFALKSIEARIKGELTQESWGASIDRSRALRVARNIK